MKPAYHKTMAACFIGYIVQAVVNNFVPLLFVTFRNSYRISLSQITLLVTVNFSIQLCVDVFSAWFVDKIGYRLSAVLAHFFAAAGLIFLTFLPDCTSNPFVGILISIAFYAVGGGLIEVIVSPMVEACPTPNKETTMSFLHSFYCWGYMAVVLLSTIFFAVFSLENWRILALLWALLPIANGILFCRVPIYQLNGESQEGIPFSGLFRIKEFWFFFIMMLCAGASEVAVSQWASTFAEEGLGVSKAVGDLAGPMAFAALMGGSRLIFGKAGGKINLDRFMEFSCLLCVASYLVVSLIPNPALGLIGCGVCGFSVGIMWPGTFSKAAVAIRGGGTALFAMLAFAGDVGCTLGPTLAGMVSSLCGNNLRAGIFSAACFPLVLFLCLMAVRVRRKFGKNG